MEYIFTLKYRLTDESNDDEMAERLGEAGCTDCVIGLGTPGRIALEFTREATNAREAIVSALADVKQAIPSACLIEVCHELAGPRDVDDFLRAKVDAARPSMRAGHGHSNDEVEARFAARRAELAAAFKT